MFELFAILMPFLVGLVVLGLGHDITDTEYLEETNRERVAK